MNQLNLRQGAKMASGDLIKSWHHMPLTSEWHCPECNKSFPTELWEECEPYCEDCGSHDGRRCPGCGEEFDHVWGVAKLIDAQGNEKK